MHYPLNLTSTFEMDVYRPFSQLNPILLLWRRGGRRLKIAAAVWLIRWQISNCCFVVAHCSFGNHWTISHYKSLWLSCYWYIQVQTYHLYWCFFSTLNLYLIFEASILVVCLICSSTCDLDSVRVDDLMETWSCVGMTGDKYCPDWQKQIHEEKTNTK